ncbi:DUF2236 domain-containing protein [Lacihabitans sp. LS3-19]|uniref:oxygenase MpaB family protein n=1 Tax=Lacihabitans sp. LS3-19 TaxID=2487335 RepID=UPI0020CDEFE0|nr:oxygenase MpaB family protein [Lacihabitans sp. LS3-19]MCP9769627.1 DUF2236 domain-containing protein [Lacihabitans sp. LS3-19]
MKVGSAELDNFRLKGDKAADDLLAFLFEKHQHNLGKILLPFLSDFDSLDISKQDEAVQDFFKKHADLPVFFDLKSCLRATEFYKKNQISIGIVLACYSLPYCYLGEDGARVLGFSGRIQSQTTRRLQETGKYILKVMQASSWENGKAIQVILKVRLMHAFWRLMILKSGNWNMDWGIPINQEDMLGTNLAFSLIVLRGLKKLGKSVDVTYEQAYLNHWAFIGHFMGIETELLVFSIKDAQRLDKLIATRQFRSSEIGKELTAALQGAFLDISKNEAVAGFFEAQSRFLLGAENADKLGIESKYNISETLLKTINNTSSFFSQIFA